MKNENEKFYRANNNIKFATVIVIDKDGKNLGQPSAKGGCSASSVG